MRAMNLPETAAGFLTPGSRASALRTERNNLGESRISGKTQFLKMVGGSSQKLPIIPLTDSIEPANWQGAKNIPSWTEEHKAARWAEYQRDKANDPRAYQQTRWDKQYETSRCNNCYGLKREREYATALGATSKIIKTQYTLRQIDLYIEDKDADTLYCGQLKTGFVYLTEQAKTDLKRDKWLVDNGYQVEYILEKSGSKPLLGAISKSGATCKIGPQIP